MKAITFPQVTVNLAEDQEQYETLPVHIDLIQPETPVTCCFELSREEIDEIVRTGKIWHTQWTFGNLFQPIRMSTQNPFE